MDEISYTVPDRIVNSLIETHGYTKEEAIDICIGVIDVHKQRLESIETKDVE